MSEPSDNPRPTKKLRLADTPRPHKRKAEDELAHDSKHRRDYEECCICLNDETRECWLMLVPCGHRMHSACFSQWIHRAPPIIDPCPLCCAHVRYWVYSMN